MNIFTRMNIRRKLLLTFIPLSLLPMLILTVIAYQLFSSRMEGYTGSQVHESIAQLSSHVDSYLDELDRLSMLPYYQPTILAVMQDQTEMDLLQRYYQTKSVESLLSQSMINPREDLRDVFLYRMDGRVIFHSRYEIALNEHYEFQKSYWYHKAVEANGKAVFLGGYADDRFMYPPPPILAITRLIRSYDQKILGAILIDADFSMLTAMFQQVDLGSGANLIVLDQDQRIVYKHNERFLEDIGRLDFTGGTSGKMELDPAVFTVYSQSQKTGWTFVGMLPTQELNKDILTMRDMIILLSLLMMAASVVAAIYISRNISNPLSRLKNLMQEVKRGNFNVSSPLPKNADDEVIDVLRTFNNMSQHIEALIYQISEVKVKQKEAELNQLKAQIRPHFLYNTLESIRALAELKENYDIAEVTSSLGNILRYSIKSHDQLVKIGDELLQAQNYVKIQRICSSYPVRLIVDVDESILQAYTIPLLFQPIIENCIRHGFEDNVRDGEIIVSAYRSGHDVLIEITDNGKGMPAAETALLNEALSYTEDSGDFRASQGYGIGLINVSSRLHLIFGEPYGILVNSDLNEGTTVLMRMPYINSLGMESNLLLREGGWNDAQFDDCG